MATDYSAYVTEACLLLLLAAIGLYVYFRGSGRRHSGGPLPPCLPSLPVLGSLPFISAGSNELFKYFFKLTKKYGNVYSLYFATRYTVVLHGRKAIQEALLKQATSFANRSDDYLERYNVNVNMRGLLWARYNDQFKRKHQVYLAIMKEFGFGQHVMEDRINNEVKALVDKFRQSDGKPMDPHHTLTLSVMNVIVSIVFGRRYSYDDEILVKLRRCNDLWVVYYVAEVNNFPVLRFIPPYRARLAKMVDALASMMQLIQNEVDKVLTEIQEDMTAGGDTEGTDSFIRQFVKLTSSSNTDVEQSKIVNNLMKRDSEQKLSIAKAIDYEELCYTVRDLVAAGTDTSSATTKWALILLANHPDVQTRLQNEIDLVVGRERLALLSDEPFMPYTQAVILETMRRYTLLPLSLLHETLSDTQVENYFIPAETLVVVNLYSVHMDAEQWGDPDVFRPERFLDEDGQVTGKDRVIPFSLGKRSCFGELLARQELFLFIVGIFQNFQVRPPDGEREVFCDAHTKLITHPAPFEVRMIARF